MEDDWREHNGDPAASGEFLSRHNASFDVSTSRSAAVDNARHNATFDVLMPVDPGPIIMDNKRHNVSFDGSTFSNPHTATDHPGHFGHGQPPEVSAGSEAHQPPEDDATRDDSRRRLGDVLLDVDDSLDSVILEVRGGEGPGVGGRLEGVENEAYDGDAETDLSYSNPTSPADHPPVLRNPDPFPLLERPLSGRYQKNPNMERKKPSAAPGPYDPQVGVFLGPPLATTKTSPSPESGEGGGEGRRVRKRIPRPPSRLKMRCAFFWSCLACWMGSFLCAIPALRYYVTANESRKIGDYNSAHSSLRKTAILAAVALALAVGAWTVLILYLSDSL